jgi:hypothetical protein
MSVTFGKRVVGEKEHAAAVARATGGADIFGKRVRDVVADHPKPPTELGPTITKGATVTTPKGKPGVISIEDLQKTLADNPSTIESLYKQELDLASGPRKAALEIFEAAELKGGNDPRMMAEIAIMLGRPASTAKALTAETEARKGDFAAQQAREAANKAAAFPAGDTAPLAPPKPVQPPNSGKRKRKRGKRKSARKSAK